MTAHTTPSALVTTIIPTYRRPRLLLRAIDSALAQEGPAVMVYVFDNASGDETAAVVADIAAREPRLRYHCHDSNIGAAANFESGLRSVETQFFSILSDDDYLLPGFYEKAVGDLREYPEAMFWAGMTLNVDESGKIWYARVDGWAREGLFAPPEGVMAMLHGMAPLWTGTVFRREILKGIGFPDKETLGPSDLDFMLRAAARYKYMLRKYPSAVFTLHAGSFSATQPISSFWPGWLKMFRNLEADVELNASSRVAVLQGMHQDAKRMLFRRAADALASRRYDFSRDAAAAFETHYGPGLRPFLLRVLTMACESAALLQSAYTWTYRLVERMMIRSHSDLESRFGHLIRRV